MQLKSFVLALAIVVTPITAVYADDLSDFFGGGVYKGKKLEKAITKASEHPLGSEKNPVRVDMPVGQRAYLSRLRCSDGEPPKFQRGGSVGEGPFGSIVDVYDVDCGEAEPGKVSVFLDMYHSNRAEKNAVPGFTIAGE